MALQRCSIGVTSPCVAGSIKVSRPSVKLLERRCTGMRYDGSHSLPPSTRRRRRWRVDFTKCKCEKCLHRPSMVTACNHYERRGRAHLGRPSLTVSNRTTQGNAIDEAEERRSGGRSNQRTKLVGILLSHQLHTQSSQFCTLCFQELPC